MNIAALVYGLGGALNLAWPRGGDDVPWSDKWIVVIGCVIVVGVGLLYMLLGRPYARSDPPAGDAVRKPRPPDSAPRRRPDPAAGRDRKREPAGEPLRRVCGAARGRAPNGSTSSRAASPTSSSRPASARAIARCTSTATTTSCRPRTARSSSPTSRATGCTAAAPADMKGGLAAMIHAMVALRDAPGRVGLNFVPDEETGGATGSKRLAEQGLLAARRRSECISPAPTGGVVWNANRGAISLALRRVFERHARHTSDSRTRASTRSSACSTWR